MKHSLPSCIASATMAVSTKSPRISLASQPSNFQFSKLPNPTSENFVKIISKNNKFSLRINQQNSLIKSISSFTADPNSFLTQLCTQNELHKAVNVLAAFGKELPTEIKEETLVSLLRLCGYKRASNEGSFIYSLVSNSFPHLSLRLGNELLDMFARFRNLSDASYVFEKMEERDLFSWNVLICGYAKNGFFDEAIKLYGRMLWLGVSPDVYTFRSVLKACGGLGNWEWGRKIHGDVLRFGFGADVDVVNALITMYVKCGDLCNGRAVFDNMEERELFSWNVLIGGYAKDGFLEEAIELYGRMLRLGISPDVYTFPCVLRACGGLGNWERGREIHGHVLRFWFGADVDVVNALITMYVKCGDVRNARMAFDEMDGRDRISWNSMIAGYFENNECLQGLRLFFSMRECGVQPDLMTMTSVISACAAFGDERFGRAVHGYVAKMEYGDNVRIGNSLIHMHFSFGRLSEAEKVFDKIECKHVESWNSMITGYNNIGFSNKAVETYKLMELEGFSPDKITIDGVLSACASLGLLDMGIKLHELMKTTGLIGYSASALIHFYSKCKCIDKALEVFHQIPDKNVECWKSLIQGLRINDRSCEALIYFRKMVESYEPDKVTLLSVVSVCAKIGALMCGKEIHAHVLRRGLAFEGGFLPNALLGMYVRCGRMVPARNQFKAQKQDVASWNTLLTGHAERGEGALATELFHEMIKSEVRPNEITFTALLCACSRSGMVTEGLQYFYSMETQYSVTPNLTHYGCVVDLLGRAGQVDNAYEFIEKMTMTPDHTIWRALLKACRIHKHAELGEVAAKHIYEMDNHSEVAHSWKTMKETGLTNDPGCSWVEVKGTVHAFLSGDSSHPQIRAITDTLQGIYEKMKEAGHGDPRSFVNEVEASAASIFCGHSERMAVAFGLINTSPGIPILVTKNLYMCKKCHNTMKFVTKTVRREISVRDTENFHHFKDGSCSCGDNVYCGEK